MNGRYAGIVGEFITFLSGVQLMVIAVIGQYVARMSVPPS